MTKPPTEDNSDSDDDGSQMGEDGAVFSPISRSLLATICIFGADGNLSTKKILPTIFQLWKRKLVPRDLLVVGYARAQMTTEQFRKIVFRCIYNPVQPQGERKEFLQRCHFVTGQFDDEAHMSVLVQEIEALEEQRFKDRRAAPSGTPIGGGSVMGGGGGGGGGVFATSPPPERRTVGAGVADGVRRSSEALDFSSVVQQKEQVRMYYMAVPPFVYASICGCLRSIKSKKEAAAAAAALASASASASASATAAASGDGRAAPPSPAAAAMPRVVERFVLEKPFGRDTESCRQMTRELSMLNEEEVYRIDHYLGKELVMNLLVLRFANVAFSSIWNRQTIKSVQVIFKEDFGCEGRGGYFDQYGIIRDVMQNHLLQVMALVAMEQPLSFTAEHIMGEKLKVLQACLPLTSDDLVTGQYVRCGKHAGYLEDPTIENKDSTTETFATAVLHVHTPRWDGVPFVLKAGKALTDRKAEVRIQFHQVPGVVSTLKDCAANELVVRLQPEQTIYWKVINKVPGLKFEVQQMRMDLLYANKFNDDAKPMPEAYERLLLEALAADHSHFVSAAELDASWRIFTPILKHLAEQKVKPHPYLYGSRGPAASDALAHKYGMSKFGGGITNYVTGAPVKKLNATDEQSLRAASSSSESLAAAATSSLLASKKDPSQAAVANPAAVAAKPPNPAAAKPAGVLAAAKPATAAASAGSAAPPRSSAGLPKSNSAPVDVADATNARNGSPESTTSKGSGSPKPWDSPRPEPLHAASEGATRPPPALSPRPVLPGGGSTLPAGVLPAAPRATTDGGVPRTNTLSPTSSVEDDSPERISNRQAAARKLAPVSKEFASMR